MARKNVLTEIRESISPRKKKNDDSRKVKEYAVLRIPQSLFDDLQVLKLAYEIMWSEESDLSSLSDEDLETWEMEKMTQEEFFRRLYQAALRMDPALAGKPDQRGKKIDYLSLAQEAYRSRAEHDGRVKSAMEQAVREIAVRARRNGTELETEAKSTPEQVVEKVQKARRLLSAENANLEVNHSFVSEGMEDDSSSFWEEHQRDMARKRERKLEEWTERWNSSRVSKKYYFVNGDRTIDARFSKGQGSFACDYDGRPRGVSFMAKQGFSIQDEEGIIIDEKTAMVIKKEYDDLTKEKESLLSWF